MTRQTILTIALLAVPLVCSNADEQPSKPQTVGDDITPQVGEVCRASSLVGKVVVSKDGTDLGQVQDVVVDPYYARLVSIIVGPDNQAIREKTLFIPVNAISKENDGDLLLSVDRDTVESSATSFEGTPDNYTRRLSLATFRHFAIKPYWLDEKKKNTSSDRDDRFVKLCRLTEQPVKSPTGASLGKIADVVISKHTHQIVYTLFAQIDSSAKNTATSYPIPLACFVVPATTADWTLELPEELLENTEPVGEEKLPKELSRAWVEYVHVRYGGGVFNGVQRQLK